MREKETALCSDIRYDDEEGDDEEERDEEKKNDGGEQDIGPCCCATWRTSFISFLFSISAIFNDLIVDSLHT
jgi:hypothetical protein